MRKDSDPDLRKYDSTVDNVNLTKLIRWNRFLTFLIVCAAIAGGFIYLGNRIITNVSQLELSWGNNDMTGGKDALFFSSLQGGPFVVTHLVTQSGGKIDMESSAIAEEPHPLLVRGPGPVARAYILESELEKLKWFDSSGKKVAPPRPGDPVIALYYETQKVATTEWQK